MRHIVRVDMERQPWVGRGKQIRPFKISQPQRAGIKRAAQWHDRQAKIFRDAIAARLKYAPSIGHWEHLCHAEEHESAARKLRQFLKSK